MADRWNMRRGLWRAWIVLAVVCWGAVSAQWVAVRLYDINLVGMWAVLAAIFLPIALPAALAIVWIAGRWVWRPYQ